jgi:glycosyltransferase involved in cell wall biosynthesis
MSATRLPLGRDSMPEALRSLRVALVHDYLNQAGGAEKVVEVFAEMFPGAPVYTSVYDRDTMPDIWKTLDVRTSFMQRISPKMKYAKAMLPFYPTAFELFDFSEYDLVLSSTTTFAKAVLTRPDTCHICYCNNPTRLLWMYHEYLRFERLPPGARGLLPMITSPLRVWDFAAAQRPDYFVAGSYNAARRIAKYYRRESDVVQPPIDASLFCPSDRHDDYFLVVSRLQAYKRIDLAVDACNRLGLPLLVIGTGPDEARLLRMAGPTVRFLGRAPDADVRSAFARCRALIFPGEEDFGLTPLEAQASGRPVVAYARGGALETVREGETGVLFAEQTVESLTEALATFREDVFDGPFLRRHALKFDKHAFKAKLFGVIEHRYGEYKESLAARTP